MPKRSKHPGLRRHSWVTAQGERKTAYYLDNRTGQYRDGGPKEIPLGTDHQAALAKWRELVLLAPAKAGTIGEAMDRWEREVLPTYRESTRRDYAGALRMLRPAFETAKWAATTMPTLDAYLDARGGKTRANRELAVLSIIWRRAVRWGLTSLPWPAAGMERSKWKNREKPRELEPTQAMFAAIHAVAEPALRDAMDIIAATGLRIRDAIAVGIPSDGILRGQASKTAKRFAIDMRGSATLAPLLERRLTYRAAHLRLLSQPSGAVVTERWLMDAWARARAKAVKAHPKLRDLGRMILRDCRKLAAEAAADLRAAADLLQHDDPRLTRAHYRRSVAPTKTVR